MNKGSVKKKHEKFRINLSFDQALQKIGKVADKKAKAKSKNKQNKHKLY